MNADQTTDDRQDSSDETHFGFASIPLGRKQALVDDVFHKVASRYDLMNDLMSVGLHRVWKNALVSTLRPGKNRPFKLLDVAGGTGDAEPYRYLVESIRRFPTPAAFSGMIGDAGFGRVTSRAMSGGIVRLHSGWKV